jgi:hypothetical protein
VNTKGFMDQLNKEVKKINIDKVKFRAEFRTIVA